MSLWITVFTQSFLKKCTHKWKKLGVLFLAVGVPFSFASWVHHLENAGQCNRCNYDVLQSLYLEEKNTRSYYDRWIFMGEGRTRGGYLGTRHAQCRSRQEGWNWGRITWKGETKRDLWEHNLRQTTW